MVRTQKELQKNLDHFLVSLLMIVISKLVFTAALSKWINILMMLEIDILIKGKQEGEHIYIHKYVYICTYVKKTYTVDP